MKFIKMMIYHRNCFIKKVSMTRKYHNHTLHHEEEPQNINMTSMCLDPNLN